MAITLGGAINLLGEIRADDELRKTITECALAGASAIFFDNQCRPATSPELSRAITANAQSPWTDRVMNENRTVSSPLSVIWGMSANNPVLSDEIARRTICIWLDPDCEHPEERTGFRHANIVGWALQNRSELLRAFLLLVQHWIAVGCSGSSVDRLGSFSIGRGCSAGSWKPPTFPASWQIGSMRPQSSTTIPRHGGSSSRDGGRLSAVAK